MKSSRPVFTRQNPFPPASTVRKSHSQPSCKQSLSKKEKKTSRSPVRSNQRSTPQLQTLSPGSQQQNKKHDHHSSTTDGQPFFSESWPSTECGSSPGSSRASYDMEAPKQCARPGKSTVSVPGIQQDSVLAKYVERFRHGQPQSREERQQVASAIAEEQVPFWWLSDSSLPSSSTPTKATDKDPAIFSKAGQCRRDGSLSPCRGSLSILSDTTQGEYDDTEILHIQERASRLLLKGECTLSDGSIPVSSEGLGSSDFSSPVSVDEPVQRPLISSLIKPITAKASSYSVHAVSSQKSLIQSLAPPTRPEEDILFQWRLRRKMEQAREWPQSLQPTSLHSSTLSWQAPRLNRPSASGLTDEQSTRPPQLSQKDAHPHIAAHQPESKEVPRFCPSASDPPLFPAFVSNSSVSQPQNIAHVPAHMHYLCDVLPCPIQSSHAREQQSISQRLDDSQTKAVHKKTQVPNTSTYTFSDGPPRERVHSQPLASSEAVEEERPSHPEILEMAKRTKVTVKDSQKNTVTSIRQQKKTERGCSNQRLPKKGTRWKEQHQQEGTDDHEPPPSPIHTALGQVVSEVLFPTVDSPPAHIPVSPPCTFSAPAQSPVPPCNAQNSMEVISQLLQEAEDSDEKEFEDDPLLQVLRKQRKWVKEQISEVDSVLTEFEEEQQVTSRSI